MTALPSFVLRGRIVIHLIPYLATLNTTKEWGCELGSGAMWALAGYLTPIYNNSILVLYFILFLMSTLFFRSIKKAIQFPVSPSSVFALFELGSSLIRRWDPPGKAMLGVHNYLDGDTVTHTIL